MKKIKIKTVLFDFDGTLVNTEPLFTKSFEIAAKKCGIDDDIDFRFGIGKTDEYMVAELKKKYNVPDNFMEIAMNVFNSLDKTEFKIFPKVENVLIELKEKKIFSVIGSNSSPEYVKKISHYTGISQYIHDYSAFDGIIKPKPYPDIFLKALNITKSQASDAVVVEDSPIGIEAAKAAGIFTIAITNSFTSEHLTKADTVINSIEEIFNFIEI